LLLLLHLELLEINLLLELLEVHLIVLRHHQLLRDVLLHLVLVELDLEVALHLGLLLLLLLLLLKELLGELLLLRLHLTHVGLLGLMLLGGL